MNYEHRAISSSTFVKGERHHERVEERMRVYIVGGDATDREDINKAIGNRPLEMVAFETAASFLEECARLPASIMIIDICLPDLDGLELQTKVKEECDPDTQIIFIAEDCEIHDAVQAMRRGAVDFLEKPFRRGELVKAVDRAIRNLERAREDNSRDHPETAEAVNLTDREREVLLASCEGQPSKLVAHELGLSVRTVEMHRSHIIRKLGVMSFSGALVAAMKLGLVQ